MIQLENPTYVISGGFYSGNQDWNNTYTHSDDCFKLYYITEGGLWLDSRQGRHHLAQGKLYLINGHKILSYGTASSFATNWLHFKAQNIALSNTMQQLPLVTELPAVILSLVESLGGLGSGDIEQTYNSQLSRLRLQGVLQIILVSALQQNGLDINQESEELQRISPAIEYVYQSLGQPIKLEDLASKCCLSVSHFCKVFKSVMNRTPNQFILAERMNQASRLLHSGMDIKRVACDVGFYDDAHFCKSFKSFFGVTPSFYRKNISC